MLTADLVRARRKGAELQLAALDAATRERALGLAEMLVAVTASHVGRCRDELAAAIDAVDVEPRDRLLKNGLFKLIEDRCDFDAGDAQDPASIRRDVFVRAGAARAALEAGESFDRDRVLRDAAVARASSVEAIEQGLFADLRGSHVLTACSTPSAALLVDSYDRAQAQAVLLRAVKVTVDVLDASPEALRAFFRRLKFLRLLHTIARAEHGHRVVIDGPFSLFESVTKYGLKFALVLPALEECGQWRLEAEVRWGKQRLPLVFRLAGGAGLARTDPPAPPDDVRALARGFATLETDWRASENTEILELPGVGLCIPDLVFERGRGTEVERVHLEVMGYWSRAAVWKRVELVQAGLAGRVLFAVSSRLRVSEEVLDGDLPSAIYVYKTTMSARAVAERLERLVKRRLDSP